MKFWVLVFCFDFLVSVRFAHFCVCMEFSVCMPALNNNNNSNCVVAKKKKLAIAASTKNAPSKSTRVKNNGQCNAA